MIAINEQNPPEPNLDNIVLVVTVERPTLANPDGLVSLSVLRRGDIEESKDVESATAGPANEETIEAIIRDLRSYVANGRKALANEIGRDEIGGKSL
jgi:hypothetical protein